MNRSYVIWLTGLPASGKTTLARHIYRYLVGKGYRVEWLDSDDLRRVLTPNPKYSEEERDWFYDVLVWIASLLYRNGVTVIISATGNKRRYRDKLREMVENFIEIYLKCDLEVCIRRDYKGIYEKAFKGLSDTVPGIGSKYEAPLKPELVVETDKYGVEESVKRIINFLRRYGFT